MDKRIQQIIAQSYKVKDLICPRNGLINGKRFEVLSTIKGLTELAQGSGLLEKLESFIETKPVPMVVDGSWIETPDLVAMCIVRRKDWLKPVVSVVSLHEYIKTDRRGKPTVQWRDQREKLLLRIATAQAIRKAFNVAALYIPEEVGVGMTVGNRVVFDRLASATLVSLDQVKGLLEQFKELSVDVSAFCDYFGIMRVDELQVCRYREAIGMLNKKRQRMPVQADSRKAA